MLSDSSEAIGAEGGSNPPGITKGTRKGTDQIPGPSFVRRIFPLS